MVVDGDDGDAAPAGKNAGDLVGVELVLVAFRRGGGGGREGRGRRRERLEEGRGKPGSDGPLRERRKEREMGSVVVFREGGSEGSSGRGGSGGGGRRRRLSCREPVLLRKERAVPLRRRGAEERRFELSDKRVLLLALLLGVRRVCVGSLAGEPSPQLGPVRLNRFPTKGEGVGLSKLIECRLLGRRCWERRQLLMLGERVVREERRRWRGAWGGSGRGRRRGERAVEQRVKIRLLDGLLSQERRREVRHDMESVDVLVEASCSTHRATPEASAGRGGRRAEILMPVDPRDRGRRARRLKLRGSNRRTRESGRGQSRGEDGSLESGDLASELGVLGTSASELVADGLDDAGGERNQVRTRSGSKGRSRERTYRSLAVTCSSSCWACSLRLLRNRRAEILLRSWRFCLDERSLYSSGLGKRRRRRARVNLQPNKGGTVALAHVGRHSSPSLRSSLFSMTTLLIACPPDALR